MNLGRSVDQLSERWERLQSEVAAIKSLADSQDPEVRQAARVRLQRAMQEFRAIGEEHAAHGHAQELLRQRREGLEERLRAPQSRAPSAGYRRAGPGPVARPAGASQVALGGVCGVVGLLVVAVLIVGGLMSRAHGPSRDTPSATSSPSYAPSDGSITPHAPSGAAERTRRTLQAGRPSGYEGQASAVTYGADGRGGYIVVIWDRAGFRMGTVMEGELRTLADAKQVAQDTGRIFDVPVYERDDY